MKKVIVIGSGVIGLCTAYFLQKEGCEVEVITASEIDSEVDCSYGNAGMIAPSHFVPLAAPGVVKQGLKWMLDSKSPLYIRPRFNRSLINWLWHFSKSANQKNVDRSEHLLKDMHVQSRDLFKDLESTEDLSFEYRHEGLMMLYKTPKYQDAEEALAEKARTMGLSVESLNKAQLAERETNLLPNVLGGVLYHSDAHINPNAFMRQMTALLVKKGVRIHYSTRVSGFQTDTGIVLSTKTNKGDFQADEFVICAGVWSCEIAKKLRLKIPLQAGKGYSMTIKNATSNLRYPSILSEAKIAMTPLGNDLRVAGTMEIAGNDTAIRSNRLQGIKEKVPQYFQNFDSSWFEATRAWVGLRPVSPDGLPYLGRVSDWDNLSVNTGHAMMGMSLGPISGKMMAEVITGRPTSLNIGNLKPQRF